MPVQKTFDEINEGDSAEFVVQIDEAMVDAFAKLSGDTNPLHTDRAFAETTPLGARVAHGMIGGALFSRLVGMHLPGLHALYLSQSLFFRKPMRLPTTVVVSGFVTQKIDAVRTLKIATVIKDAETGTVLTDGETMVQVLV